MSSKLLPGHIVLSLLSSGRNLVSLLLILRSISPLEQSITLTKSTVAVISWWPSCLPVCCHVSTTVRDRNACAKKWAVANGLLSLRVCGSNQGTPVMDSCIATSLASNNRRLRGKALLFGAAVSKHERIEGGECRANPPLRTQKYEQDLNHGHSACWPDCRVCCILA